MGYRDQPRAEFPPAPAQALRRLRLIAWVGLYAPVAGVLVTVADVLLAATMLSRLAAADSPAELFGSGFVKFRAAFWATRILLLPLALLALGLPGEQTATARALRLAVPVIVVGAMLGFMLPHPLLEGVLGDLLLPVIALRLAIAARRINRRNDARTARLAAYTFTSAAGLKIVAAHSAGSEHLAPASAFLALVAGLLAGLATLVVAGRAVSKWKSTGETLMLRVREDDSEGIRLTHFGSSAAWLSRAGDVAVLPSTDAVARLEAEGFQVLNAQGPVADGAGDSGAPPAPSSSSSS